MIIRPVARTTTALNTTYTCGPENPYCLSTQRISNDTSSSATGTTGSSSTPHLSHRNLVGILVIAALLALGLSLWLCFGKWSKPIRRFLRGEQCHNNVRFGIGDGLTTVALNDRHRHGTCASTTSRESKTRPGPPSGNTVDLDVEKTKIVDSSSWSTQGSFDREGIKTDKDKEETKAQAQLKHEPAPPAKALHAFTIKSGSQLARLGQ